MTAPLVALITRALPFRGCAEVLPAVSYFLFFWL